MMITTPVMPFALGTKLGPDEILSSFSAAGGGQHAASTGSWNCQTISERRDVLKAQEIV